MTLEDAAYELLGIPHATQPVDAYRLLGIACDESNPEVIRNAAARQILFVRQLSTGRFASIAGELIQRLTAARESLLDQSRHEHHATRRRRAGGAVRKSRESRLWNRSGLTPADEVLPPSGQDIEPPRRGVEALSVADPHRRDESSACRDGDTDCATGRREWIIGADSHCDLVVRSRYASRRHCRVWETEGLYWVEDLGSRNGTHVNQERVEGRRLIHESDVITLGARVRMPWPPTTANHTAPEQAVRLITLGRSSANDVVLRDRSVSRVHAQLSVFGDHALLEDRGSTNGTFVGECAERVSSRRVTQSDIIRLGKFRLRVGQLIKDEPNR